MNSSKCGPSASVVIYETFEQTICSRSFCRRPHRNLSCVEQDGYPVREVYIKKKKSHRVFTSNKRYVNDDQPIQPYLHYLKPSGQEVNEVLTNTYKPTQCAVSFDPGSTATTYLYCQPVDSLLSLEFRFLFFDWCRLVVAMAPVSNYSTSFT